MGYSLKPMGELGGRAAVENISFQGQPLQSSQATEFGRDGTAEKVVPEVEVFKPLEIPEFRWY